MSSLHEFAVQNRASVWLSFTILVVAATMMHPTGASLFAIVIIGVLLTILRWVAHLEGKYSK